MTLDTTQPTAAADIQRQFPAWDISAAPGGRLDARLRQAPWVTATGGDPAELADTLACFYNTACMAEALLMLRHEVREYNDWQDQMNELRARRISALEQATSARWPRRLLLRARLVRAIRHGTCTQAPGPWHARREQYVFQEWASTR
jgi:hypothetical protein